MRQNALTTLRPRQSPEQPVTIVDKEGPPRLCSGDVAVYVTSTGSRRRRPCRGRLLP